MASDARSCVFAAFGRALSGLRFELPRTALVLFLVASTVLAQQPAPQPPPCATAIPYGDNPAAGRYAEVNGIRIYYEIYGVGPPLLLIHGNTGSIIRMSCQINAFSPSRMVIAVDTRGRGKSGDGVARFTFEQQADDLAVLLARERVTPTDVLGQSDGGIVALLLGIRHPAAVRRIVASAPNLRPDDTALVPDSIARLKANIAAAERQIAAGDRTQDWERRRRQLQQDLEEPHLTRDQLRQIDAPVLLVGADEDVIRPEHYLEMYRSLPHGQLFIVPGTIHGQLLQSPLFGAAAQRFFDEPFARPVAFPQASQP